MSNSAEPPAAASRRTLTSITQTDAFKDFGVMFFFLVLIVLNAFITPNFLSLGTLQNTLVQVAPVMLVALGMTLVISSGGIDISVGAIMAISAAVSARLYTSDLDFGLVASIGCGLAAAAVCGLFNGILIARYKIQPIIVTLILMIAGRGLAQVVLGKLSTSLLFTPFGDLGQLRVPVTIPLLFTPFGDLGLRVAGTIPLQIAVMAVAVAVMLFVARKTVFAKHIEAIGDNRRAAQLVGINTVWVTIGAYVLCALLCGIAGNMEAARNSSVNVGSLGVLIELDAIAAVAIGGTPFSGGRARILGTAFGAIVVQLVTVIVNMNNIPFHYSLMFKALIVIVALWAQRKR